MTYLIVLEVRFFRVTDSSVATQGAFAEHLRLLRKGLSPRFSKMVIAAPEMAPEVYENAKNQLAILNEEEEGIYFDPLYSDQTCRSGLSFFLLYFFPVFIHLYRLVRQSSLLHCGLSSDVWRPINFMAVLCGILARRKMIYVVDTDFRNIAKMLYESGEWSLKSYLLCKYVYDTLRSLQVRVAVRFCSLVLLKGAKMCEDYGRGRSNIRNFLDAAHSETHLIDQATLAQKLKTLERDDGILEIVYFGRLVRYKAVDICIQAVHAAQQKTRRKLRFHIFGSGGEQERLVALTKELGAEDTVRFHEPIPFGPALFGELYKCHLLLATPRREDTPRSALDAMAAGIPILAFDTYYYTELEMSGAVVTVPWQSREKLAEKIAHLADNRDVLATMAKQAVAFARGNTQEAWLKKRFDWTWSIL